MRGLHERFDGEGSGKADQAVRTTTGRSKLCLAIATSNLMDFVISGMLRVSFSWNDGLWRLHIPLAISGCIFSWLWWTERKPRK